MLEELTGCWLFASYPCKPSALNSESPAAKISEKVKGNVCPTVSIAINLAILLSVSR